MWHVYYRNWLRWKKRPDDRLDADAARELHKHRKPYAVLFADIIHPAAVLELRGATVRIALMDHYLREWMVGLFEVIDGEKMFLAGASFQTFRGKSDAVALLETHQFDQDGTVVIKERHYQTGFSAPRTVSMDISQNWAPYPSFGDYEYVMALHWSDNLNGVREISNVSR